MFDPRKILLTVNSDNLKYSGRNGIGGISALTFKCNSRQVAQRISTWYFCWLEHCLLTTDFKENIFKPVLKSSLDQHLKLLVRNFAGFFFLLYTLPNQWQMIFTHNKNTSSCSVYFWFTKQVSLGGLGKTFFYLGLKLTMLIFNQSCIYKGNKYIGILLIYSFFRHFCQIFCS